MLSSPLCAVWPRRHRVVFFGVTGESLLRTYVSEEDVKVYVGPRTKLNIWVALFAFIMGWWGARGYYRSFLLFTRPKFVVTFEDNALEFYLTKRYLPNCVTICIQNGRRDTYSSNSRNDIWELIRQATDGSSPPNVVLIHGETWLPYYQSALGADAKIISIGSVRNNRSCITPSDRPPRMLFVSSFPNLGPDGYFDKVSNEIFGYWQKLPLTFGDFFRAEGHVAASAATIAKTFDIEFCVLGKRPEWQKGEFRYFEAALGKQYWKYLPAENKSSSYERVNSQDIIVSIDSTFGYEMFARGLRVAFISCRMMTAGVSSVRDCEFAYPLVTEPRGEYWTNSDSLDEIRRVITSVLLMGTNEWNTVTSDIRNSVMTFDSGNQNLCTALSEAGLRTSTKV